MRTKIFIGASFVVGALAISTLALSAMTPSRRAALVHFTRPTLIAGTFVFGRVVIVHDDEKMARGEACTTLYHYDPKAARGEGDSIVNFHCQPKARSAARNVVVRSSQISPAGPDRLLEYQLVGEVEGHGVPIGR
jgi:hypothetical protein